MGRFAFATAALVSATLLVSQAFASGGEHEPNYPNSYSKEPAKKYSGNTPIDSNNGLLLNHGTYGMENKDYEAWAAAPAVVAGLSEQPYSFRQKKDFVNTMKEQITWGKVAIGNWKNTSKITRPEAVEYGKKAVETMSPLLENLEKAVKSADGANEKEWTSAESNARKALIDFRTAYTQMHHNTQWKSRHAEATR